ncbi:MAG: response regulator [Nitrospirota bacterium]|nr:response regulator [Nitrospirota bacterium]
MIRLQGSRAVDRQFHKDRYIPVRRLATWMQAAPADTRPAGRRNRIPWSEVVRMKTILLIDNNVEHLLQHSELLGRSGYRIVTAQDSKAALFILESGMLLDLIVTECQMPDMGAQEFLAAIRKEAPSVPVVVVTSCDSVESYLNAVGIGVYEYLNKPLLPGELSSIIKMVARDRRCGSLPTGLA